MLHTRGSAGVATVDHAPSEDVPHRPTERAEGVKAFTRSDLTCALVRNPDNVARTPSMRSVRTFCGNSCPSNSCRSVSQYVVRGWRRTLGRANTSILVRIWIVSSEIFLVWKLRQKHAAAIRHAIPRAVPAATRRGGCTWQTLGTTSDGISGLQLGGVGECLKGPYCSCCPRFPGVVSWEWSSSHGFPSRLVRKSPCYVRSVQQTFPDTVLEKESQHDR